MDSIRRIVRALRISSRSAERELGLTGAQVFVLQKLNPTEGISLGELADRTLTHQSSVSVVVRRLLEKGLITRRRSPADGRRLEVALSKKGEAFLKGAPVMAQERVVQALDGLPTEQCDQLAALLEGLIERAGLSGENPALFFEED